jgi:YVTN family beta-propeller protein
MQTIFLPIFFVLLVFSQQPAVFAYEKSNVLILNSRSNSLSIIDAEKYRVIKTIRIGKEPHHLLATPDRKYLVIGNTQTNELVLTNPRNGKIIKRIPNIMDPYHLGFSRDGKWFVITANRLDYVDIYQYKPYSFKLAKRIKTPSVPSHMVFSADGYVYVTLQNSNRLIAIRLSDQKTMWAIRTDRAPAGIWISPNEKLLLVANTGINNIQIIERRTGKILKKLITGKGAHNFLPLGDKRYLLLSNRLDDTVSIIDSVDLKIVGGFKVPGGPDDMELKKNGRELWVTARWRNRVHVVDLRTRKVIRTIKVGRSPHGIYYHEHAPRF